MDAAKRYTRGGAKPRDRDMGESEKKGERIDRILGAARAAAAGDSSAPVAIIEAPDRDLLRALRKASPDERRGLLKLLGRVGLRGKRVAEQALGAKDFDDQAIADLLAFLAERQPEHPLVLAIA